MCAILIASGYKCGDSAVYIIYDDTSFDWVPNRDWKFYLKSKFI